MVDVIDRREEGRNTRGRGRGLTYDQGAHEILDTVAAEVEVWVCVGKLRQRYRRLLLANRAAGEVGLAEDARGVGGVVELDALVEALKALSLVIILDAGPVYSVSNALRATLVMKITYCLTLSIKSSLMPWAGILKTVVGSRSSS